MLTEFYWDQIPNYAAIAVPLTNLLRKGQPNSCLEEKRK